MAELKSILGMSIYVSRSISSVISLPDISSFSVFFGSTAGLTIGIDTIVDDEGLAVKVEKGDNKD